MIAEVVQLPSGGIRMTGERIHAPPARIRMIRRSLKGRSGLIQK
jgi:hypothetical protein